MDNGTIFNLLNTIIRKEKEGQTISPAQFSELLDMCQWEKANADYSQFENNQVITDSLQELKREEVMPLAGGIGDITSLSDEYWHATNASHVISGYESVPFDIVSDIEFQEKVYSDLELPTVNWPILKIVNNEVIVRPGTITTIRFMYLKKPSTPFYDYYIDADDNLQYMAPGTNHTLLAGEEYRDGTTSGVVNSISVELSFPENERIQVLYIILEKLGVALNEPDVLQYGLNREQKEEIQ